MSSPSITIFTPTYNRFHTLSRLFKSLCNQTCNDFEWIVIDDGSSDNTENFFSSIIAKQNLFQITYKKKKNGGKHRAINDGVKIAQGRLFFIVDSDDYLTEDAVEKILSYESTLDYSHKWAGISGLKGLSKAQIVGQAEIKERFIDAKNTEREKLKLLGDKAEAYYTEILRKYPFPEFDNEKFITEEVVWNAIANDGYYIRWFKDIIYICEYLDDGLSKNRQKNSESSPKGVLYWRKIQLKAFPNDFEMWKRTFLYYYNIRKKYVKRIQIAKELEMSYIKLLYHLFTIKIGLK